MKIIELVYADGTRTTTSPTEFTPTQLEDTLETYKQRPLLVGVFVYERTTALERIERWERTNSI